MLFPYIRCAPDEIIQKFASGITRFTKVTHKEITQHKEDGKRRALVKKIVTKTENKEWYNPNNHRWDCSFNGLLFKENRVLVYKIIIYNQAKDYEERFLDITDFFNEQLEYYNIYHNCLIITEALKNLYREAKLTENLMPIIQTYDEQHLPKYNYEIQKQKGRERKFIESCKDTSRKTWDKILHRAIKQVSNLKTFQRLRKVRPHEKYFDFYTQKPILYPYKYRNKSPTRLQKNT